MTLKEKRILFLLNVICGKLTFLKSDFITYDDDIKSIKLYILQIIRIITDNE